MSLSGADSDAAQTFKFSLALFLTGLTMALVLNYQPFDQRWGKQGGGFGAFWPQGWSFFDDAAETGFVVSYHLDPAGRPIAVATQIQLTQRNFWGLRRQPAAQRFETLDIRDQIPPADWIVCGGTPDECSTMGPGRPRAVVNHSRSATLCGLLRLEQIEPLPWTPDWRPGRPTSRVKAAATVQVTCEMAEGR